MKEESRTKIRKLDAAASKTNAVASKIRELNAATSILDTATCEGQIRVPRVGCRGIQNGCLGIGSALKNQSPIVIRFLSLISLPRFK